MRKITKKKIIKDNNYVLSAFMHVIFAAVGLMLTFAPLIYTGKLDKNSIIGMLFCFLIFGIPFGYFMGIRKVKIEIDKIHKIKRNQFKI